MSLNLKEVTAGRLNRSSHDNLLADHEKREIIPLYNDYKANVLIVGPTKSGKTSFIVDLLNSPDNRFDILTILAPRATLDQGKYDKLIDDETVIAYPIDTAKGIPPPRLILNPKLVNLVIFDDVLNDQKKNNLNVITEYLVNGSRFNASIYISLQALKELAPRYRNQCKIWCLSAMCSVLELKAAFEDVFDGDFTNADIRELISIMKRPENKYKMLICNNNLSVEKGRYRLDDQIITVQQPNFRIPDED